MNFVERQILPRYNDFGKSHGLGHVQRVIKSSLALAAVTGADVNMVYVIAAYHDLGMAGPRAIHHITSGKILIADARLRKWFSAEQLKIMKEAVEDHRASSSRVPRSIYGKIDGSYSCQSHLYDMVLIEDKRHQLPYHQGRDNVAGCTQHLMVKDYIVPSSLRTLYQTKNKGNE